MSDLFEDLVDLVQTKGIACAEFQKLRKNCLRFGVDLTTFARLG
jgi:hypothetical protein